MPRRSTLRSDTSSVTLSCITCVLTEDESAGASVTAPSTSLTSNTDVTSVPSSNVLEPGKAVSDERRVRRVCTSVHSYNENILSGSARKAPTRKSVVEESRNLSGQTLVPEYEASRSQLIRDSIQLLNLDLRVDSMPGDEAKQVLTTEERLKQRVSTRLNVLERASSVAERTKSALGKRSREAAEHGKEKLHGLDWRSKLRPRLQAEAGFGGPVEKKVRMSADTVFKEDPPQIDAKRKAVTRPKTKRWLSQGLYVGQERDFDPRLTEAKNKLKRASTGKRLDRQSLIFPLPMFAGQRTLEIGRDFRLPFDIFSPLSPGQPKPEEWRKTQKRCDENCLNRFMFYECDETNCNIGTNYCTNRSFEDLRKRCKAGGKYNIGVEVIKTIDRGHGVRSNRTFDPNQIIVEYTGEIITQDECDSRMRKMYKDNECFYLMVFDQNMIIDATRGSIARFINHSCEPNCKMIKWTVAGKPRMALFAGDRGVMTGEELTYDYNFDPFSSKNIQECRCSAPTCRGVLGPKPKDQMLNKPKDTKDALQPLVNAGTKRKFQQAVEQPVDLVASKKRKIAIPSTIKTTLNNLKRQVSRHMDQAKVLTTPDVQKGRLGKKVSERSLRGLRGNNITQRSASKTTRQNTVAYTKRRPLNAYPSEQPLSHCGSVKAPVSCVRRNMVRTIRGSTGTGAGKSIRIIGYEET
ncbi:hypothetical protein MMC18_008249 [Xylographa bjoerkii]|nr:hypothetical protein [Xylographa bjoerkii]